MASDSNKLKKFWMRFSRHPLDVVHQGLLGDEWFGINADIPRRTRIMYAVVTFIVLWMVKTVIDHPSIISIVLHRQS